MIRFLPPKAAPVAYGFLLSGFMTFLVSGIATVNAIGWGEESVHKWMTAWGESFIVAFPIVLVVAPSVHWIINQMVKAPPAE